MSREQGDVSAVPPVEAARLSATAGQASPIPLIIIGCGGHGRVVWDIAETTGRFDVIAILDDAYSALEWQNEGVWHGPIAYASELLNSRAAGQIIIAIGTNATRRDIADRLGLPVDRYAQVIHPGAHISRLSSIAPGTVIMPGAVVNAGAQIGAHAIVNSGAVVEHDAIIGAYAHLSPQAAVAGSVSVGEGTHLGIGSCTIPSVMIGAWSVLGAGATAVRNIPSYVVAAGVPAKVQRTLD